MREGCAVVGLLAGAVALQLLVPSSAPVGYGLAKWAIVLNEKGSTGYFQVAKHEAGDLPRFLAAIPIGCVAATPFISARIRPA